MKNIKNWFVIFLIMFLCSGLYGCFEEDKMSEVLQQTSRSVAENQKRLETNQPAPQIQFSNARDAIARKTITFNDPNKISYIYLISKAGTILGFYTVKGCVVDLSCYMVPDDQIVDDPNGGVDVGSCIIQAPDIDGTYGTNGAGKYFFTTDGTYVEFNCEYILCDKPLSIAQPPILTLNLDQTKKTK